jgi:hypothetical protein
MGAWLALGAWLGWTPALEARFTAIASGVLAIAAAGIVRWTAATRDWAVAIAGLAIATATGSVLLASTLPPDEAGRQAATCSALIAAAAGTALGLVARPLRVPVARPLATGLMTAAGALAWYGLGVPAGDATVVASASGVAATIAAVVLSRRRPGHAWSDGLLVLIGGAGLLAVLGASASFPDRGPMEAVLLLVGICCAALGVGIGRPWLVAAAPVPLTAAWLLFASEALTGHAQAFTVPIGVAVLVVAENGRSIARDADAAASPELRILEYAGMVFVVSGGLVEAVSTDPMRGLGALLGGVAIACWGALTHVRRRVAFGACTVFLAAVEIPILSVIPTVRTVTAPAVWAGLVLAGVVVLAIATGMERHRTRIRSAIGRIDTLMEGWE